MTAPHDLAIAQAGEMIRQGIGVPREGCGQDAARPSGVLGRLGPGPRSARGLAHGVGQGGEVVVRWRSGLEFGGQAYHLPAARGGEGLHMLGAQVVGLGLGLGGQRAQYDRGVRVDARQGGDGGILATGPAAASDSSPVRRLSRQAPTEAPDARDCVPAVMSWGAPHASGSISSGLRPSISATCSTTTRRTSSVSSLSPWAREATGRR